jgi:osmoprotectant transport system permease protein
VTALLALLAATAAAPVLHVGSKSFTESVILGDIATDLARGAGVAAEHQRALGGTRLVWEALLGGAVHN